MSDAAVTPGSRLKGERETRGLSAQKAADQLHLDAWVIDALEAGDYPRIGPAVYAKGHLKRYAALLELPAAEILAGFEAQPQAVISNTAVAPSMLLGSRSEGPVFNNLSPLQIIGGIAVVVVALGVVWWKPWQQRGASPSSAPAVSNQAPSQAPSADAGVDRTDVDSAPVGALDVGASSTSVMTVAEASNQPTVKAATATPTSADSALAAAAGAAGAGRARLRMSFSANSWVDVHDADGKLAYSGNGMANSVKTIAGLAPLRVYLGVGSGVQLEINGRAVAIGPQFFSGNVARFAAGADGVLRRDAKPEAGRGEAPRLSHAGSPTG